MKKSIKAFFRFIWGSVSQNLGWKIFSLVVAVLLWSYIVITDPTVTRDKTLSGVEIVTNGLSVLQSRDLALLTDPAAVLEDVRVRVRVPQASYNRVTSDNVRVELDMSRIRQTGIQEVELNGVSVYGEVVQVTPSTIEVMVEKLDERNVPVNVRLTGADQNETDYWHNVTRINPSQITVSGPSSVVQQIVAGWCKLDVSGVTGIYSETAPIHLMDKAGNEISQSLSQSSSSVTVNLSIYPTKQLEVGSSVETATTGAPPEGFRVSRVEVQPEIITAAADAELLEQLQSITFNPVNVSGRRQSFSITSTVNRLKGIQYLSSEQVTVTVYIEEVQSSKTFQNVPLGIVGRKEAQIVELAQESISLKVTGPYSVGESLVRGELIARVDVSKLEPGEYEVPVTVSVDNYPDLTFELEPPQVSVIIGN